MPDTAVSPAPMEGGAPPEGAPETVMVGVGDRVEANWKDGGEWWPAKITSINDDGTFTVKYDDGSTENVAGTHVRELIKMTWMFCNSSEEGKKPEGVECGICNLVVGIIDGLALSGLCGCLIMPLLCFRRVRADWQTYDYEGAAAAGGAPQVQEMKK